MALDNSFYHKLNEIGKELGLNPRDLLLVMSFESGVNPNAKNPGGAQGLIQFMPATLRGLGVPKDEVSDFRNVPANKQLDYVKRYIEGKKSIMGGKPFTSATQYYHANFFPKTLTRWHGNNPFFNKNVVVVGANSSDPAERAAYKGNQVLDKDHDGKITVGDLTATLMGMEKSQRFQSMLQKMNEATGQNLQVSEVRYLNKKNKNYQPDVVAPESKPARHEDTSMVASFLNKIENALDKLVANNDNKYSIIINSNNDLSSKIEFARILRLGLKEELNIQSDILLDNGRDIELACQSNVGEDVLKEIVYAFSDVFEYATKQIGGVKLYPIIVSNNSNDSNKKELDVNVAYSNYRKFQLKFAKKEQ